MDSEELEYEVLKSGGYATIKDWHCTTGILGYTLELSYPDHIKLDIFGKLTIFKGYRWDGASVIPDTKSNMRPGLAHDALYELLRQNLLPQKERWRADTVFRELYQQNGGWHWWTWTCYAGLRLFAGFAASPKPEPETIRHTD